MMFYQLRARRILLTASLLVTSLSVQAETAFSLEATRSKDQVKSAEHFGGALFTFASVGAANEESVSLTPSQQVYQEFLSRGRYSRVKSIGGYSSGGGSYAIRRGGGRAVKTSSSRARLGRRGGFAGISNSGGSIGAVRMRSGFN